MSESPAHVVLILHGIRDMGAWQKLVSQLVEKADPGFKCIRVRYGWYGPVSFMSPFDSCVTAYAKLHQQYERAKKDYPHARISIIAHSFGTYLTGRLLAENPNAEFYRIILCGGVLSREFDWRSYRDQIGVGSPETDDVIVNECGNRDPWPFIAESISSRYGASGAYGFEKPFRVVEKYYEGGHGLFFDRDHIESKWVPFLTGMPLGKDTALAPKPGLGVRILLTVPGAVRLFRIAVGSLWFAIYLWWFWALIAAGLYATGTWPFDGQVALCERDFDQISYSVPADFALTNPSNHPKFPDRNRVTDYQPRIPKGEVSLEVLNESGFDLWLLLFDCSRFYSEGGTPWLATPAPVGPSPPSSAFQSASGWYVVAAYRSEFEEPIWLSVVNLRNSSLTTVVIQCESGGLQAEIRQ